MTRLLALDPGLKTFGAALLGPAGALLDIDAIETEASADVKATRAELRQAKKAGRSVKRARGKPNATDEQLADRGVRIGVILSWIDEFAFGEDWIKPDVVVAEAGRAMRVGTDGVIAVASGSAICVFIAWKLGIPIVWATPREWRKSLVPNPADRRAGPSEKEIEAAHSPAMREWIIKLLKMRGRSITLRGHAFDAHAMGMWSLRSSINVIAIMRPPNLSPAMSAALDEYDALGAV